MKSPRIRFIALLLLLGSAANARQPGQANYEAETRNLQRLETVWNEAHQRGDADALEAL
jgi:hypothetical protein